MKKGWNLSDLVFKEILVKESLDLKLIEGKNPLIFYLGKLTCFEKNQIFKYVMKERSNTESLDELFETKKEEDGTKQLISLQEIEEYQETTRKKIIHNAFKEDCRDYLSDLSYDDINAYGCNPKYSE